MRRKWAAITLAVALAVGVAALPSPAEAQTTGKDRKYLALVKSYAYTGGVSNRQLVRMGKQVCKTFDAGATLYDVVDAIVDSADTDELQKLFAATIAGAVVVYCPRHQSELE